MVVPEYNDEPNWGGVPNRVPEVKKDCARNGTDKEEEQRRRGRRPPLKWG